MTTETLLSDLPTGTTVGNLITFLQDHFLRVFANEEIAKENADPKTYCIGDMVSVQKPMVVNAEFELPELKDKALEFAKPFILAVDTDGFVGRGGKIGLMI